MSQGESVIEYILSSPVFSGSVAGTGACMISTPFEVVKTRLQLQGELKHGGQKVYTGFLQGLFTILKYEGLSGIYSGISPAIWYQVVMNGVRFGSHDFMKDIICTLCNSEKPTYLQNVFASGLAGVFGACVGSPFYLVKVRLQSSTKQEIAVGHQHHYKSMMQGLKETVTQEGFKGLWRGAEGQLFRVGVGSAVQISTYEQIKFFIEDQVFFYCKSSLCSFSFSFLYKFPFSDCYEPSRYSCDEIVQSTC